MRVFLLFSAIFVAGVFADSCQNGVTLKRGLSDQDKQTILDTHNEYRNTVAGGQLSGFPGSSNMKKMVWDDNLAAAAQAHAEQCVFDHYKPNPEKYGTSYGQNLHQSWASGQPSSPNWKNGIQGWYNEYSKYPVSAISSFRSIKGTGHFTQVVWAESGKVGCGYVLFKDNRADFAQYPYSGFYTCNYGSTGNMLNAPVYKSGTPCSSCSCDSKYRNLCA